MTRASYVMRDGQLVERHLAPAHPLAGRRLGRAPYIRTDGMDPIRSMASGRMFDSRSAYYADVRAAGCEIVGDDRSGFERAQHHDLPSVSGMGRSLSDAIDQLEAGSAQRVEPGPAILGGWD